MWRPGSICAAARPEGWGREPIRSRAPGRPLGTAQGGSCVRPGGPAVCKEEHLDSEQLQGEAGSQERELLPEQGDGAQESGGPSSDRGQGAAGMRSGARGKGLGGQSWGAQRSRWKRLSHPRTGLSCMCRARLGVPGRHPPSCPGPLTRLLSCGCEVGPGFFLLPFGPHPTGRGLWASPVGISLLGDPFSPSNTLATTPATTWPPRGPCRSFLGHSFSAAAGSPLKHGSLCPVWPRMCSDALWC